METSLKSKRIIELFENLLVDNLVAELTPISSKKFFNRKILWLYQAVFSLFFQNYFFSFLNENEQTSSNFSNFLNLYRPRKFRDLQLESKPVQHSILMAKASLFSNDFSSIEIFWSNVRNSLFDANFQNSVGKLENRSPLFSKLSILLFQKIDFLEKHPDGKILFEKEIGILLGDLDRILCELMKLFFLREQLISAFFQVKPVPLLDFNFLIFLISFDEKLLWSLNDLIMFYENVGILESRLRGFLNLDQDSSELKQISFILAEMEAYAISLEQQKDTQEGSQL